MPKIEFLPAGKTVKVPEGTTILEAAAKAGLEIEAPCGGEGTCGDCIVQVTAGEVESGSRGILPQAAVAEGYALACQAQLGSHPVTVVVPDQVGREGGKFSHEDETYLIRSELLPRNWQFDPLAVRWLIQTSPPQVGDGLGDLDRLTRAIRKEWGKLEVLYSLRVMRRLAGALRAQGGIVTVTMVRAENKLHVIHVEPGDHTTRNYAIAVDVGTTTVAVQLIHLSVAKILATRSSYNDQMTCGLDIISRINYARHPDRLEELRRRVLTTINRLIHQVVRSCHVNPHEISNAVISANTTMNHLLLGIQPEQIRLAPYTPTVLEVPYLTAAEVGIDINPDSWVCFSPNNGSYVGGDITAGLLCTDLATSSEAINLFVDIGTNGELVVGNRDFLMSCACSAGPAFEGGGIEWGMRAAMGAIEKVEVDPETGAARWSTIGNVRPQGICGSGMIDLLANLFLTGWIDAAGKFNRSRPCCYIQLDGKRACYTIVPEGKTATGEALTISEVDIENIIRAKAAIYSACSLMLRRVGIEFSDLEQIYIAGGFGRFLELDKAIVLGLMPDLAREKFRFIGNASLIGSYMVVVSQENRERQIELARRMTYIDLSNEPGYMDEYTGGLFLPHTDRSRFPTVRPRIP